MAIPGIKVVLLLLGQVLQCGSKPGHVRWARRCIQTVQVISKWACPDMFAYILMLCLFRGLNKPPNLQSSMELGLGFSCFTIFCVGSTVSSLGIRVPSLPAEARDVPSEEGERLPVKMSCLVGWPTFASVTALAVIFVALLGAGVILPVMELRLDMALLYERKPELKLLEQFINDLHLPELMHEEVSVWTCLRTLSGEILQGSVNSGLAFLMYGVFATLMPLLHMLTLVLAASRMRGGSCSPNSRRPNPALAVSRVLGKMSMLDVSIRGVVVIVLSMVSMRDSGVILSIQKGIPLLIGAEICRYLAAFLVSRAHTSLVECGEQSGTGTMI